MTTRSQSAHTDDASTVFFTAVDVEDTTLAPVAAALHGTVLQTLALMRWQLDDPDSGRDQLRARIREAETELRIILGTIRPCDEDDEPQQSLDELATTYMRFYDTKITHRTVGYVPVEYRRALYQLTRRALGALVVVAKATEVSITVRGDDHLTVDITGLCDVGNGEHWTKPLTYLRDRLRLVGGTADIGGDDTTTRIQLTAPIRPDIEQARRTLESSHPALPR